MAYRESTLSLNTTDVSDDYLVIDNDYNIIVDASLNECIITLPDPNLVIGQIFCITIKDLTHSVKVNTVSGLINDSSEFIFTGSIYRAITVQSIGTDYVILWSYVITMDGV